MVIKHLTRERPFNITTIQANSVANGPNDPCLRTLLQESLWVLVLLFDLADVKAQDIYQSPEADGGHYLLLHVASTKQRDLSRE